MKKVILTALALVSLQFSYAQEIAPAPAPAGISSKAVFDDFMDGNATEAGINEYIKETTFTGINGVDKAYTGVFWSSSTTPGVGGFIGTKSRTGDGILGYSITQNQGKYEPIVLVFGEYKVGSDTLPFTLDLSLDKTVSLSIKNAGSEKVRVKFQLQDANGVALAYDKGILTELDKPYNHEIGYVQGSTTNIAMNAGESRNFSYNFADGLPSTDDGKNIDPNKTFDFTKVRAFTITVVADASTGDPNYEPLAITAYPMEFSNFKLGDISTITSTVDETVIAFNNETVTVYNTLGKVVATGKYNELSLEKGQLYIVRSASKTQKVILN